MQALNAAGGFAGYTDWRLPNQKELQSIVERQCVSPSVNAGVFPATVNTFYWSASPYAGSSTTAWGVGFYGGFEVASVKTNTNYVRLVRGGQ